MANIASFNGLTVRSQFISYLQAGELEGAKVLLPKLTLSPDSLKLIRKKIRLMKFDEKQQRLLHEIVQLLPPSSPIVVSSQPKQMSSVASPYSRRAKHVAFNKKGKKIEDSRPLRNQKIAPTDQTLRITKARFKNAARNQLIKHTAILLLVLGLIAAAWYTLPLVVVIAGAIKASLVVATVVGSIFSFHRMTKIADAYDHYSR